VDQGESQARRALHRFYGGQRCVVTGKGDAAVHHLDDNHHNWIFENIVPLRGDLNQSLESFRQSSRSKKLLPKPLDERLIPDALLGVALSHLRAGDFPSAYGTSRLGCFIATKHQSDFRAAVQLSTLAMYSSRPTRHICLAADTLARNTLGILKKNYLDVGSGVWAELVREIGCHYLDYGHNESFVRCKRISSKLLVEPANREEQITQDRIEQHDAFRRLREGEFAKGKDLLGEITEKMAKHGWLGGYANNMAHIIAAQIRGSRLDAAEETLEALERRIGKVEPPRGIELRNYRVKEGRLTWWTAYSILLRKADLLSEKGETGLAKEFIEGAQLIGEYCGISWSGMLPSKALTSSMLRKHWHILWTGWFDRGPA